MEIKDSILLPKTEFSMKADLPNKEPAILERWQKNHLYENLRNESKDKEKFILHDGPPYAKSPKIRRNLFCMMARLMPMVIYIWGML